MEITLYKLLVVLLKTNSLFYRSHANSIITSNYMQCMAIVKLLNGRTDSFWVAVAYFLLIIVWQKKLMTVPIGHKHYSAIALKKEGKQAHPFQQPVMAQEEHNLYPQQY